MSGERERPSSLVYAFACDDARGSEPGAGAALAGVAGEISRATVLTAGLATDAADQALRERLGAERVVALRPSALERRLPLHLRYGVWSLRATRWTARERRAHPFDVLHHATYASDWFINPLTFLRKRPGETWVLGPVGGASYPSLHLARAVTGAGVVKEVLRKASTSTARRMFVAPLARRVDRALALNADTEHALRGFGFADVEVSSNAVLDASVIAYRAPARERSVAFLGRGVAWKGLPLVLAAARHLPADAVLHVGGPGTDTPEYRALAEGAACQVVFHGKLPRAQALALLARSGALAIPSLHDSAPWAAAEASALGVPTVCLPLGGVAHMAGAAAVTVELEGAEPLEVRLARALKEAMDMAPPAEHRFTREAMVATLGRAYGAKVPSA